MERRTLHLAFCVLLMTSAWSPGAESAATLEVWPGRPPGENGSIDDEKVTKGRDGQTIVSITNVSKPTLTVYRPDKAKDTGVAVLVCPGGGYNALAWDHEGEQVARWLNSLGITGAILKYRVPRRADTPKGEPPPQPLQDAQRALRLVRSNAAAWGVDPKKVGMLGFSAGGHLTVAAETNADRPSYEPIDEADRLSCRPDFAVLIYPGGALKKGSDERRPEIRITSSAPPTFLVHASDDPGVENSLRLYLAFKQAGVPAELHVYGSGGHGFGMRPSDKPHASWPQRCEDWMRSQKILSPAAKPK
ncbi:MAG: alpha/beta hydrolase [Isosphaeraceae bacterium]|nr:alpha/beta hydrolase [Isosphaeraceae bacterium]